MNSMMFQRYSTPEQPDMLLDKPHPIWFISRGNGSFTPVIPVDELPKDVVLRGVPRIISVADARGLEFLGEFTTHGQTYSLADSHMISTPPSVTDRYRSAYRSSPFEAPDAEVSRAQSRRATTEGRTYFSETSKVSYPASKSETYVSVKAPTRETPICERNEVKDYVQGLCKKPTPSGIEPDQSQKTYCTHWIKTGECDYMQQGCRYKHEVPDRETLISIGIRNIPKWWEEKNAVKIHPSVEARKTPEPTTWLQRRLQATEEEKTRAGPARKDDRPRDTEHRRSTPVPASSSETDSEQDMRDFHARKSLSRAVIRNSMPTPPKAKEVLTIQRPLSKKTDYADPDSGVSCMDISPPYTPIMAQVRGAASSTTQRRSDAASGNGQRPAMSTQREASPVKGLQSTSTGRPSVMSTHTTPEKPTRGFAADADEPVNSAAFRAQAGKIEAQRSMPAKPDFKSYFRTTQEKNGPHKQGSDRADSDDGEYQPPPTPPPRRINTRSSAASSSSSSSKPHIDTATSTHGSKLSVVKSAGGLMASKYANKSPPQPTAQIVHRPHKKAGSVISVRSNSDGRQRRELGQSSRLGRELKEGLKGLKEEPIVSRFWSSKIAA